MSHLGDIIFFPHRPHRATREIGTEKDEATVGDVANQVVPQQDPRKPDEPLSEVGESQTQDKDAKDDDKSQQIFT